MDVFHSMIWWVLHRSSFQFYKIKRIHSHVALQCPSFTIAMGMVVTDCPQTLRRKMQQSWSYLERLERQLLISEDIQWFICSEAIKLYAFISAEWWIFTASLDRRTSTLLTLENCYCHWQIDVLMNSNKLQKFLHIHKLQWNPDSVT